MQILTTFDSRNKDYWIELSLLSLAAADDPRFTARLVSTFAEEAPTPLGLLLY